MSCCLDRGGHSSLVLIYCVHTEHCCSAKFSCVITLARQQTLKRFFLFEIFPQIVNVKIKNVVEVFSFFTFRKKNFQSRHKSAFLQNLALIFVHGGCRLMTTKTTSRTTMTTTLSTTTTWTRPRPWQHQMQRI